MTAHLVLVGGGHTHALVLDALARRPQPGLRVTLLAKEIRAPYSGMLPGFVAGHYGADALHIDLPRLAAAAGVQAIHGAATGIDRAARLVRHTAGPPLPYDLLSLDVGIVPDLSRIAGAAEHAVPVKPVSTFAGRWETIRDEALQPMGPRRFAVIGAGVAGVELVLALRHRLLTDALAAGLSATGFRFLLVGGTPAGSLNPRARRLARAALERAGVEVEPVKAVAVDADGLTLEDGRHLACDVALVATGAAAPGWLAGTDLPRDPQGFLAVRPTLQLLDDDDVFAVGDCAAVLEHPRPKAGVFAVRQAPALDRNLRRRAEGRAALPFVPQRHWLVLLALGDRRAIAARGPLALEGDWIWRWKDRIDRGFMARFPTAG